MFTHNTTFWIIAQHLPTNKDTCGDIILCWIALCTTYSSILSTSTRLYVDIPGYENADALFTCNQRPDLVLVTSHKICIIELIVCFETNLIESRNYKIEKYKHLKENVNDTRKKVELIFVEISSLGFYTEEIGQFKNFIKDLKLNPKGILEKCSETCIRCSYYIYNRRSTEWTSPELLLFV